MTEVAYRAPAEVLSQTKPRRLARVFAHLRKSLEPPFPQVVEYNGPPEPYARLRKIARAAVGSSRLEQ